MTFKESLVLPYRYVGKTILLTFLYVISMVVFVSSVFLTTILGMLNIPFDSIWASVIAGTFYLVSLVLSLIVMGYVLRVAQIAATETEVIMPALHLFSSFWKALVFLLALVPYGIVFILLSYIGDLPGIMVRLSVILLIILFGPALFVEGSLATRNVYMWHRIFKLTITGYYLKALGFSILVWIMYGVIAMIPFTVLLFIGDLSTAVTYMTKGVELTWYVFVSLTTFLTLAALFGQSFDEKVASESFPVIEPQKKR